MFKKGQEFQYTISKTIITIVKGSKDPIQGMCTVEHNGVNTEMSCDYLNRSLHIGTLKKLK